MRRSPRMIAMACTLLLGFAAGWSAAYYLGAYPLPEGMAQVEPIRMPPSTFAPNLILDPETAETLAFLDLALERLAHAVETWDMALAEYSQGTLTADRTLELSGRFTDATGFLMTELPDLHTVPFMHWMNGFRGPLNSFEEARECLLDDAYDGAARFLEQGREQTVLFRDRIKQARDALF